MPENNNYNTTITNRAGRKPHIRSVRQVSDDVKEPMEFWQDKIYLEEESMDEEEMYEEYDMSSDELDSGCEYDSEWEVDDTYWDEPRAPAPVSGRAMDGQEVGCVPHRCLELPRAAISWQPVPAWGRSVLETDWE